MTPEQQKEILKIIAPVLLNPDVQELWKRLQECEKLKENNRRLLMLVEALSDEEDIVVPNFYDYDRRDMMCVFCGELGETKDDVVHHPDCQVLAARKLLEEN